MARASPIITATNAGELSPTLDGRVDLAKYTQGCRRLENFLSLVQGPAVRRGGSRYVAATKAAANRGWLVRFEYSATQAYVLEFGDLYVRFYTDHGTLLTGAVAAWSNVTAYTVGALAQSGGITYYCILAHTNQAPPNATYWYPLTGSIYEIPSPYPVSSMTNADGTCALTVEQSGDVLYIAHAARTFAPRKLTRFADTNWQFSTYQPNQGPFLEMNATAVTIQASGTSGGISLTASSATFAASDIGRLVRLECHDLSAVKPWETNKAYLIGDLVRSDGKTYSAQNNATSGAATPTHEQGNAYDGKSGVQWAYQDAGYGVARITAYTSPTVVSATVIVDELNGLAQMPQDVVSTATKRWQLGAWSATTEYPACLTFFRSRLFWAGRQRIWGSVPDDFENMAADFFGEVRSDNAIARIIAAKDVNDIQWLVGTDRLIVGTGGGEFTAGEITTTDPLGPGNFEILPQSARRVRRPVPVKVGTSVCYMQRAGRKLLSLNYDSNSERFLSSDLVVLAERATRGRVIDMAYQGEPYSIIWCVLESGKLLSFTYDQEQNVMAWARHPIGGGGFVESVVVIPTPDAGRDEVWLTVRRTINGATVRYVEFFERPWEGDDEDGTPGDDQSDAFYVDAGLTYDGAPATTITGLDHLEGQAVQVLADGARRPDAVVDGGQIELGRAASVVQVGLQYVSRLVTMRIEAGAQLGTAQGKLKRLHAVVVRFLETLGGKIGRYDGQPLDDLSLRNPVTPMGTPDSIASGDYIVDFPGEYDPDGFVEIVQDAPLPMTVISIMPDLRTYD